jgi:D-tyrosyl-tRNA(Tyr) deacylase|tara:strand:- start:859 stop:1296 length:438 start_codon:yes stop_codon:yes gene_type:complete
MIGLIQRVSHASVRVDNQVCGEIDKGILLLLAVEPQDQESHAERLLEKVLNYRVFSDSEGKMNLSLRDIQGGLLVVSQFTLAANTKKGLRPSFTSAAAPAHAEALYNIFASSAKAIHDKTQYGIFGADMQVSLCNDGPVTFSLQV